MRLTVGMCPALTDDVLLKLRKAGITNIMDFMLKDSEALAMETSVSYKVRNWKPLADDQILGKSEIMGKLFCFKSF